jgi:hypothetical protein
MYFRRKKIKKVIFFLMFIFKELFAYCGFPIPRYSEILGFIDSKGLVLTDYQANDIEIL